MRAVLRLPKRATYSDYLAAQQNSESRLEYIDGVIVAMAGGSDEHNAIAGRLAGLSFTRMTGHCRYYTPDQRFWIAARGRGRYGDGSIICGTPAHPPHDDQATTNPVVVFEVLSPSSEGDDEGDKRMDFQSVPSLRAYVLVAQDERCVRVFRWDDQGAWRREPDTYRDGDHVELPTLTSPVAVADMYDSILDTAGHSLLRRPL